MKEYSITLTEREIEVLQICLCNVAYDMGAEADRLEMHNESGINTNAINLKRERKTECDNLWQKLYDNTKNQ